MIHTPAHRLVLALAAITAQAVASAQGLAAPQPGFAGTHIAIGPNLVATPVAVMAVREGRLLIRRASADLTSAVPSLAPVDLRIEDVLLLTPVLPIPAPISVGILGPAGVLDGRADAIVQTTDGQRLWLELLPPGENATLETRIAAELSLSMPLDGVRSITFDTGDPLNDRYTSVSDRSADDRLTLANGDVLTGFVESIGPEVLIDAVGVGSLPATRIARIDLANPPAEPPAMLVTTRDGWIVASDALGGVDSRVLISLPASMFAAGPRSSQAGPAWNQLNISLERFAGFARVGGAGRVVSLAATAPRFEPIGRRWSPPPAAGEPHEAVGGLTDITLPGPMRVAFPLPPDSTRFATTALLTGGPWGECRITITAVGPGEAETTIAAADLAAGGPGPVDAAEINAPLPPGATTLVITLDSGRLGPIQDVVRLVMPRLLVGPRATAPSTAP